MDAEKLESIPDNCYYFIFVNISEFSQINSMYGNDAGDQVLLSTVDALRRVFLNGTIYRTGSYEFVIVVPSDDTTNAYNNIINSVNTAHAILLSPHETPAGQVTAEYKIAVAKKSEGINASIISSLKDLTERNGNAVFGQVQYLDLDAQAF
jgi:GGDEF domain-containing protein